MGFDNVVTGDMGGTSFDASLVQNGMPHVTPRFKLGELETGISLIDVVSIGAGGGSIGWIDQRGVPQVGPQSAGSLPGPACYERGGLEPTVTDAAVVLGLVDPDNYLGGRFHLDASASVAAMDRVFGDHFGWTPEHASEAVFELAATNMAHALRRISVERGHDPRRFLFFAFGGTLPMFVTRICEKLHMSNAVIPLNSSVFSAFGVLTADYVRRYSRTVEWDLRYPDDVDRVNQRRGEMLDLARKEAEADGFEFEDCTVSWAADLRFQGQVHEVPMPLPDRAFDADDAERLGREFPEVYERNYGKGSAWADSAVLLLNINATCSASRPAPPLESVWDGDRLTLAQSTTTRRAAISGSTMAEVPVYRDADLPPGTGAMGPAIVDLDDTTLVIGDGW